MIVCLDRLRHGARVTCLVIINLRRSHDCLRLCVRAFVRSCVRAGGASLIRFIQFALGSFYDVHINALSI